MVFAQQGNGAIPLLACAFLAFCAVGAFAQGAPAVLVGESPAVRPGHTATLTIESVGAPGQRVQLTVAAEFAPAWLAPATWQSGPASARLHPAELRVRSEANTCTVAFDDETATTDDYGVVNKDDTDEERRWECHSDNGTVLQCSLPKDDG